MAATLAVGMGLASSLLVLPAGAQADTALVTANVTSTGTRVIASITPGVLSAVNGSSVLTAPLAVSVAETTVSGDSTGWSVTAQLTTPFSDGLGHTMPASAVSDGADSVLAVAGGGALAVPQNQGGTLDQARTLMTNSGQLANTLYTGTYTSNSTLTLTPPSGTVLGTYTATLTVTLLT